MKKYFIFTVILFFTLSFSQVLLAQTNPTSNANTKIFESIKNIFSWSITIVAILAGISFAWGAIQYMFLNSHTEGKERMFGSVIGLVLCLTSIIILTTVNPKIIDPININPLPGGGGVYLVKNTGERISTDLKIYNTSDVVKEGYIKILYECLSSSPNEQRLLVSKYLYPNFEDNQGNSTSYLVNQIECGGEVFIVEEESISMQFERPGVYFYTDANCTQMYTGPYDRIVKSFPVPFADNLRGAILYTGGNPDNQFAVTPYGTPNIVDENGEIKGGIVCSNFSPNLGEKTCIPFNSCTNLIKSALIFRIPDNTRSGRSGVDFYSETSGWSKFTLSGKISFSVDQIDRGVQLNPEDMEFQYPNPDPNNERQKVCKTFKDCPGSIRLTGGYQVILLYDGPSGNSWSKSFIEDAPNIASTDALNPEYPDFYSVIIVPIISEFKE